MTRAPVPARRPAPRSFGQVLGAVLHWVGSNFWRAVTSAILAGAFGYAVNVLLMLLYYDGYVKTGSGPATGQGNLINGSVIWGLGTTVFFALWSYRRAVGGKRFWGELRALPGVAQGLLKADGPKAYVHLLWGAALALVTMQLVSPWLGGIMAIGILGMLPSFMTRVLVGFGQNVWSWVAAKVAPKAAEPPGAVSMVVGIVGSSIALVAGYFLPGNFMSLILSVGCGVGAYVLARRSGPPGATGALLLVSAGAAMVPGVDWLLPGALAHDGGLPESGGSIVVWWKSEGSKWLLLHATAGGVAAGIGAPTGIAIGDMWAREPLDQSIIDEILRQPGVMVDPNWDEFRKARGETWPIPTQREAPPAEEPPAEEPPAGQPPAEETPPTDQPIAGEAPPQQGQEPPVPPPSQAPQPPPPPPPPKDGDVNPETGEVWSDEDRGWVGANLYAWEKKIRRDNAEAWERSKNTPSEYDLQTRKLAQEIAAQKAQIQAQKAAEEQQRQQLQAKLIKAYQADGRSTAEINDLAASGDTGALADLYKDHLRNVINTESARAQSEANWATAYDAGYYASKFVLAGSKTAMVVVAGPAGWTAAAAGSGVIRAAEEGAQTYVSTGGDVAKTVKSTAGGFVSGVKDGVVSRYTNLPGVGPATKVLLPAAADAGETYVRTGSVAEAAKTGLLSAGAGAAGARVGGVKNVVVREGAQVVLGGATGAAGAVMSGGSVKEGFVDGMINAAGGSAGGHAGNVAARSTATRVDGEPKPLTPKETQLNEQAEANLAKGRSLVDDYKAARTPQERADATKAILENRDAKILMKGEGLDDSLKARFASDTDANRTQPLLNRTAERLNGETTADGKPRFVVQEPDPANPGKTIERPVEASDFKSGSGSKGGPGQDFDMYSDKKIVDTTTGRPAKADVIDGHVTGACNDVGISRTKQEVNYIHGTHAEAFKVQPGETPPEFIARAKNLSDSEAQSVSEVNRHKLAETGILHDPAGAVGEQCRTAIKDYDRLTKPLLDSHPNARVPDQFRVVDRATGETPFDIMRQVGEGKLPPGDGNARFRAMTGMSLEDGAVKMAGWAEGIAKGGGPESHLIRGATSRDIAQATMREAMRREALKQL